MQFWKILEKTESEKKEENLCGLTRCEFEALLETSSENKRGIHFIKKCRKNFSGDIN